MKRQASGPSPKGRAHALRVGWRAGRATMNVNEVTPNIRLQGTRREAATCFASIVPARP